MVRTFLAASVCLSVAAAEPFSFRTDILPVLTKAGCNAGACHGAATGQGDFNLSLLGYDPEEDYDRITRQMNARRVDLHSPTNSLLLRKGSNQLEHEGGRRLPRSSAEYEVLRAWIAKGAPAGDESLFVASVSAEPADILFGALGETKPLRVTATLSNGAKRDVTSLALYSSNDDVVAEVDKAGVAKAAGEGSSSIMIRFGGQVAAVRVALPFSGVPAKFAFAERNFIDGHIGRELKRLHVPPSPAATDAQLLRRITLDLAGRLPTLEEARKVAAGPSSKWKGETLERLLASEEFTDFWTMRLADWLLLSGKQGEKGAKAYHDWLRAQVAGNRPINVVARDLILATGDTTRNGPANFYTLANDPRDMAEHASSMFLGVQLACARCHAHPTDRWTQTDYHQFAAFFAKVTREGPSIEVGARGEVDHPKTGAPMEPRVLTALAAAPAAEDRRAPLAEWVAGDDNPFFARAFVNRVWRHLFGRGLVEPVDDLRPTNPASHPALLDELAERFIQSGFDLRALVRVMASSHTYQLSARALPGNERDERLFARAYPKPLPAQVFLDAVAQVTGVPEVFEGYPEGTRAVQLVGARQESHALDVLGRCSRTVSCDTPGLSGGGLAQALHLINGSTINDKLGAGRVSELAASQASPHEIVTELYLRAFTRLPTQPELALWAPFLASAPARKEAIQDLVWTLLNSREFALND